MVCIYDIRLFGQCSGLLDPALDTSPLNWNIISFTVNFHNSIMITACLELLSQIFFFYFWKLSFSRLWLIIFDFPLLVYLFFCQFW